MNEALSYFNFHNKDINFKKTRIDRLEIGHKSRILYIEVGNYSINLTHKTKPK